MFGNYSAKFQIRFKLSLLWICALCYFKSTDGPERVTSDLFPINSLYRVFLEHPPQKIIEVGGGAFNREWTIPLDYHCNKIFQRIWTEGRLPWGQLKKNATQWPKVWVEGMHPLIVKEFWGHVIRCPRLTPACLPLTPVGDSRLWVLCPVVIGDLFWQSKVRVL